VKTVSEPPALVTFLNSCVLNEPDKRRRDAIATLAWQWENPKPFVKLDDVWDAMVAASRTYRGAPGYQERWVR
jgi:hypothetical protein